MEQEQKKKGINIGQVATISFTTALLILGAFFIFAVRVGVLNSQETIIITIVWLALLNEARSAIQRVFYRNKPNKSEKNKDIHAAEIIKMPSQQTIPIQIGGRVHGTELTFLILFILTLSGGFIGLPLLMISGFDPILIYTVGGIWFLGILGLMVGLMSSSQENQANTTQIKNSQSLTGHEIYTKNKKQLIQDTERLKETLKQDIQNIGTNYRDTHITSVLMEDFSKSMALTTDALIHILPKDTSIMSEFDNREEFYLYLDALIHEMGWIKKVSSEMQKQIQSWIVYHHIEIRGERQKLEQLLKEGNNKLTESMGTLLALSRTISEEAEGKKVENILIRQRV